MPIGSIRDNKSASNNKPFSKILESRRVSEHGNTNDSTISPAGPSRSDNNHLTRSVDSHLRCDKNSVSSRADSPAVGLDLPDSQISDRQGNTRSSQPANQEKTTNGTPGLSRARKRARSEAARTNHQHSSTRATPFESTGDQFIQDMDEEEDQEEEEDNMNDENAHLKSRDFDYVLEIQPDTEIPLRGRQRRQTYQLSSRRRDSSLGGYGNSNVYCPNGGTMPRRRRGDISLTRATTIHDVDPLGTMRMANRLAQSIRAGSIPPPPSEPPPATPLSGSIMSELGSAGMGTPTGLFSPFALQLHTQQQQQQRLNAALAAAVASGRVNPQLLASVNTGMTSPYLLNSPQDAAHLMQLQQQQQTAALLQQQQQQLMAAGLIHPNAAQSPLQSSHYGFTSGTLGRRGELLNPGTTSPLQSYVSAAALFATQQQQQQHPIYQTHALNLSGNGAVQLNDLTKMSMLASPSGAMLQQESSEPLLLSQHAGPGSVVYENSYNSFHRLLSGNVTQSASQDCLQNPVHNGQSTRDGLTLSMNSTTHTVPVRSQTLGPGDTSPVTLVQNLSTAPLPPPNHPSYDMLDARSIDPTYGTHATLRSSANHKSTTDNLAVQIHKTNKRRCPWYYWIISILVLAFLLALVLAISFSAEKQHLGNRLVERFSQDPAIIGLFDPENPPVRLEPNKPVHILLDRMGVWSAEWHVRTARHVRYNITVSSELTVIGLFMRRSTMPTITQFDIFDRIVGHGLQPVSSRRRNRRTKRAAESRSSYRSASTSMNNARETGRIHYLDEGIWFLAFVNDKPRPEPITFSMGDAVMDDRCPNDCSNRGVCNRGNCDCVNGFKGPDCSVAELPKICNGHGDYVGGSCQCYSEWKGRECEVLWSECADPLCSDHGQCITGECQCYPGYSGESCEYRTCASANCSGNGVCQSGICRCFSGWSGQACDLSVPVMHTASLLSAQSKSSKQSGKALAINEPGQNTLPSRSANSARPLMDAGSPAEACFLDCGSSGSCVIGEFDRPKCQCLPGWSGHDCSVKLCSPPCSEDHGQCVNGTCVCDPGWSGSQCGLDDCPDHCNGHGQCIAPRQPGEKYRCSCSFGWRGSACQTLIETLCDDGQDNDQDGLIDCLDPDCCASSHCRELIARSVVTPLVEAARQSCAHSEPFHYRLLVTQMAQPGSTFFGQLEFLLHRDGVALDNFDPRRISVVTGTVRQWDGTPFWGVRVSDSQKMHNGYTLTDEQGRFDLPVDGGSIVRLEFLRFPTRRFSASQYVYVPVNEIIQLGDFYLHDAEMQPSVHSITSSSSAFSRGGLISPSPVMHDLWINRLQAEYNGGLNDQCIHHELDFAQSLLVDIEFIDALSHPTPVCVDATQSLCVQHNGAMHYSIPLKDTRVRLVYRSDRSFGHQATIRARVLSGLNHVPASLVEVHFVLDVAGLRLVQRLQPQPNLDVVFYWNKTDAYNRTVYGVVNAKVSAGFVYLACSRVIWEHRTLPVQAHELPSSELANWNLNIVHLYSVNHGIVYRGDGSHQFLKYSDWHVWLVLGRIDGVRRQPDTCSQCLPNQSASGSPLLYVHSLISDTAGHVLVADGNYLRWLQPIHTKRRTKFSTSDSLESRAQSVFREHSNRVWSAQNISTLPFLRAALDHVVHPQDSYYVLASHPSFLINQSVFDQSNGPMGIQSGSFLAHVAGQTIWWLADSTYVQPLVSAHCGSLQGMYPALTRLQCVQHPLHTPSSVAATPTELYFADDGRIWSTPLVITADNKQKIHPTVGDGSPPSSKEKGRCLNQSIAGHKFTLRAPAHLVYSAFENALYFADGRQVYRFHISTQMVSHIAGRQAGCSIPSVNRHSPALATEVELSDIRGLAVTPEGDIYIAEQRQIRLLRADGRLYTVAGRPDRPISKQPNTPSGVGVDDSHATLDLGLAKDYVFANITAISVTIYGELFVADMGHNVVYRIHYQLPTLSDATPNYRIFSPLTDERHMFNPNGQIVQTENAITQMPLHQFDYRAHTIFGWLSDIRGNNVNLRFRAHRGTEGQLLQLQTPLGLVYNVSFVSPNTERIGKLGDPLNGNGGWEFNYSASGLLIQIRQPQDPRPIRFQYAVSSGRLEQIVLSTGRIINIDQLQYNVSRITGLNAESSTRSALTLSVGEPMDRWIVNFTQGEQFLPSGVNRLQRLTRYIRLPARPGKETLDNVINWIFDWNTSGTGSNPRWLSKRSFPSKRNLTAARVETRIKRQIPFPLFASAASVSVPRSYTANSVDWQYQKNLVINGFDVLHVKFDWARQLETYQHPSTGHTLLQIVYNADFQPMIFNASALLAPAHATVRWNDFRADNGEHSDLDAPTNSDNPAPLSVSYTSNGQVSTIHWGSAHYRFTYDSFNRIKAADLGSPMDSLSFQYTDDRIPYQPTVVSVTGLGQFKFVYMKDTLIGLRHVHDFGQDSLHSDTTDFVGLSRIVTPSGLNRDFSRSVGLGLQRLMYTPWPGAMGPWIYEWGIDLDPLTKSVSRSPTEALLRFIWSSGRRRLTHLPQDKLFIYDQTTIRWDWNGMQPEGNVDQLDMAPYVHLSDVRSGYRLFTWRTYYGPLVDTVRIQQLIPGARNAHPALGGLLQARFRYGYNENFKLVEVHTQLYTQSEQFDTVFNPNPNLVLLDERTLVKRDPMTGQVLSIKDFDVLHRSSSISVTYAPRGLQLHRQSDSQGRLRQVVLFSLSSPRDPLYNLSFVYHPNSLDLVQQREEQRGQVPRWVTFVHGPGGRLEAIDREEVGSSLRSHSVLVHNTEGRVARLRIAISDPGQQPDPAGSTSRSEELQFVYDTRGLLKRRGNWQYTFDEDGFLTERRMHEDRIIDKFAYNSKGLLVWAERSLGAEELEVPSNEPVQSPFDHSPIDDDIGLRRAFCVQYVYDELDRLVIVRDTLTVRDFVQYFYAEPDHPQRVTHVFHHGRLMTTRLHYDPVDGHVIAIEEFDRVDVSSPATPPATVDNRGLPTLIGMRDTRRRSGAKRLYFVITNHEGAPIALISEDSKTIWTAEYSVTGIRRLSLPNRNRHFRNPTIEDAGLPLSHAGCLVDMHTGFLFCPRAMRGAAYDPLGATFLTPDWRRLLSDQLLVLLHRDPSVLDFHKWGSLEQHALRTGSVGLTDRLTVAIASPDWWLSQAGLNLRSLLPSLCPCNGIIGRRKASDWATRSQLDRTQSETRCLARQWNDRLERIHVVQSSKLSPGGTQGTGLSDLVFGASETMDLTWLVPAQTMFGPEVFISLDRAGNIYSGPMYGPHRIKSTLYFDEFPSVQVANTLLDGARLVDWWTDIEQTGSAPRLIQLIIRLGHVTVALRSLDEIGLKIPMYHGPTSYNLTVHTSDDHQEIWLTRRSIQWRIRFTSTWDEAYAQARREAQVRGQTLAWAHEAQQARRILSDSSSLQLSSANLLASSNAVCQLLGFRHLWTYKELFKLKQQSHLTDRYRWVPVVPVLVSNGTAQTRLLDDPGIYQVRSVEKLKQ